MRSRLVQNILNVELPFIASADGVWLTDTAGKRYLDGCSGAVVAGIGHGNQRVIDAMATQADRVSFTHRGAFSSHPAENLADHLGEMTDYPGVWFVNSGSEAVEAAMQFALQYYREKGQPDRQWFLSSAQGYHGNTLGGLSLSGHARRAVAGDLAYDFPTLPTPYFFRDGMGRTEEQYSAALLDQARDEFEKCGERLAAIVLEPVGGATLGATVPPRGYLHGLKSLCLEFGVLMITDEVMTGLGRTGTMLASEHFGITADLVALGKGLGAGYTPIAATLVSAHILEAIASGSGRIYGGHTYAGNPLSAAIADAVLDVLHEDDIIAHGRDMGILLRQGLDRLAAGHTVVSDVRGIGMLLGIEFAVPDLPATKTSPGELTRRIVDAAKEAGVLVYGTSGGFNEAVLVAPPLTITREETAFLLDRLDDALTQVESELN